MTEYAFPNIVIHELNPGQEFTGVDPETLEGVRLEDGTFPRSRPAPVTGDGTTGPYTVATEFYPLNSSPIAVTGEDTGLDGDGATLPFAFTLNYLPVVPTTVVIQASGVSNLTDDGSGNLTGADGSGTIDYLTGEVSVTYTTAPAAGDITVDYSYGSFAVSDGSQYLVDDGAGSLTGDGSGTIDYASGVATFTFASAVTSGQSLDLTYRPQEAPSVKREDGRIQIYERRDDGGLYNAIDQCGNCLHTVVFYGPGTTQVDIYLVDSDGFEYLIHSEATSPDNFVFQPEEGVIAPPGWAFKVVSTGTVSEFSRLQLHVKKGWHPITNSV